MGELSERLPEGGGVGDRHLRPQEDHQGNPDRLRQSRQEKVKKSCTNKNFGSSIVAHLFIPQRVNSATTASSFITVQQRPRKSFFSDERMSFSEKKTFSHQQFIFLPKNRTNSTFLSRSTSFSSWAGFYWNLYAAKKPIFSFWVDWLWDLLENETRNICTIAKHHICASKIFVKIQTLLLSTL